MPVTIQNHLRTEERDKIVAEKNTSETTQKVNKLWYENGQAVVQSTFAIQDHAVQYAQRSFVESLETLKSHIEAAQPWMQMRTITSDKQEKMPSLMESSIEAYKRNITLLQRITEQGTETYRANAGVVRDLAQTLLKNAQD